MFELNQETLAEFIEDFEDEYREYPDRQYELRHYLKVAHPPGRFEVVLRVPTFFDYSVVWWSTPGLLADAYLFLRDKSDQPIEWELYREQGGTTLVRFNGANG